MVITAPTDITACEGWYDAKDYTALAAGAGIATLTDKSVQAGHYSAAGSAQPTFVAAASNGHPAIRFDGVGQFFMGSAAARAALTGGSGVTVFAQIRAASTTTSRRVYTHTVAGSTSSTRHSLIHGDVNGDVRVGGRRMDGDAYAEETYAAVLPVEAAFSVLASSLDYAAGTVRLWENNVEQTPVAAATVTIGTSITTDAGAAFIGSRETNFFYHGDIQELIFYNRPLTAAERADVVNYLNAKWSPAPAGLPLMVTLGGVQFAGIPTYIGT